MIKPLSFRGKEYGYYFSSPLRPRFSEIDHYGVVWNGHYLQYFETARIELCHFFHLNPQAMQEKGLLLPVVSYSVDIMRPLGPSDEFTIAVRPSLVQRGILEFFHILTVQNVPQATCKVRHGFVNQETLEVYFEIPPAIDE